MLMIIKLTLKGIFRDRVFQGIMALAMLFLFIPAVATLSMRQVAEFAITLYLSLNSFIMLLLSIFLGATLIWKDIERRYTYSVISLPMSRTTYLVGKFMGVAVFLLIISSLLCVFTLVAVKFVASGYAPAREIAWETIMTAFLFDTLKYILLVAVAILFSTVSTSFFLPIFGTICTYMIGTITQQVYDFINTPAADKAVAPFIKKAVSILYYFIPNLSAFDLKLNAIYALPLNIRGLLITFIYFMVYSTVLLVTGALLFGRREMK